MANIEILNEDCMAVMGRYPDNHFDLVICELDPQYYQDAVKRFNLHRKQQRLFV